MSSEPVPGTEHLADALSAILRRTVLQQRPSSIPGREIVQVITEIPPGVQSGWHIHPGEEVGYIVAGTVEMMIKTRRRWSSMPATVPHPAAHAAQRARPRARHGADAVDLHRRGRPAAGDFHAVTVHRSPAAARASRSRSRSSSEARAAPISERCRCRVGAGRGIPRQCELPRLAPASAGEGPARPGNPPASAGSRREGFQHADMAPDQRLQATISYSLRRPPRVVDAGSCHGPARDLPWRLRPPRPTSPVLPSPDPAGSRGPRVHRDPDREPSPVQPRPRRGLPARGHSRSRTRSAGPTPSCSSPRNTTARSPAR